METQSTAVIILNWNGWRHTIQCLESVLDQRCDLTRFRIVLVDNGSRDGSAERIREWAAGNPAVGSCQGHAPLSVVTYDCEEAEAGGRQLDEDFLAGLPSDRGLVLIISEKNRGFAAGMNLGISYALRSGHGAVFLLNNDACVAPQALEALVTIMAECDAGIVGASVFATRGGREIYTGRSWPGHLFGFAGRSRPATVSGERYWSTGTVCGSACLIRRDVLDTRIAVSGHYFDPDYFLYCEDVDLGLFAHFRGFRCVVARDAVAFHAVAQSSGGMFNPRSYYYITRNRILVADRWLSRGWRALFHFWYIPSRLLILLLRAWRGQGQAARAMWAGLWDGYCGKFGPRPDVS
jgi:GT2 family glycosyltransferase